MKDTHAGVRLCQVDGVLYDAEDYERWSQETRERQSVLAKLPVASLPACVGCSAGYSQFCQICDGTGLDITALTLGIALGMIGHGFHYPWCRSEQDCECATQFALLALGVRQDPRRPRRLLKTKVLKDVVQEIEGLQILRQESVEVYSWQ